MGLGTDIRFAQIGEDDYMDVETLVMIGAIIFAVLGYPAGVASSRWHRDRESRRRWEAECRKKLEELTGNG